MTGHACLRGAVEVGIQDPNPKSPGAQSTRQMERQRALADPAFAGTHGDEMTHAGEPVSDAAALFGNLLENSGPSVADDVVVALHFLRSLLAYTVATVQDEVTPRTASCSEIRQGAEHGFDCHRGRGCADGRAVDSVLLLVRSSREGTRTHLVHVVEAAGSLRHWPGHWWSPTNSTRHRRCARGALLARTLRAAVSAETP